MPDERSTEDDWKSESRKRMIEAIHALCQPLTTLQCRLEMATLVATLEAYREAAESGLAECRRMVEIVESMREVLRAATQESAETEPEAQETRETKSGETESGQ